MRSLQNQNILVGLSLTVVPLILVGLAVAGIMYKDNIALELGKAEVIEESHKPIAFFYDWPNVLGDTPELASAKFDSYDAAVFGECIELPAHGAHDFTNLLVDKLNTQDKEIYGYVDIGLRRWTQAEIDRRIEAWKAMGVDGIFLDDFNIESYSQPRIAVWDSSCDGEYNETLSESETKELMEYAISKTHEEGLVAFTNTWMWDENIEVLNQLTFGDIILSESHILSDGKLTYSSNTGATNIYEQYDRRLQWMTDYSTLFDKVQLACLSTFGTNIIPDPNSSLYKLAVAGAMVSACDYNGISDISFGGENWKCRDGSSANDIPPNCEQDDFTTLVDYEVPTNLQSANFNSKATGNQGVYTRMGVDFELDLNLKPDSYSYAVTTGSGNPPPVNNPPTAVPDNISTEEGTPVTFDPKANDIDLDGDVLTVESVSNPSNGTVTNLSGNQITYTPTPDFTGSDMFTYTISDGNGGSDEGTINVTVMGKVAKPQITPPNNEYLGEITITITSSTPDAEIYYTTDGSIPTKSSNRYVAPFKQNITEDITIKAKAYKEGLGDSDVESVEYRFDQAVEVGTPVFSPGSGTYSVSQSIEITCPTPGASIYYKVGAVDQDYPTQSDTKYSEPILVDTSSSISAIAYKDGVASLIASAAYVIDSTPPVEDFTLSVDMDTFTKDTIPVEITIKNLEGQVVYEGTESVSENTALLSFPVDADNLPVGSYTLVLKPRYFTLQEVDFTVGTNHLINLEVSDEFLSGSYTDSGNGETVEISDVAAVISYLINKDHTKDISGDGKITIQDVALVIRSFRISKGID